MKERLTGAIILVALLVLLVPELLTGPEVRQPAKPAGADGAQLRSYTIDLHADRTNPPPTPAVAVAVDPVGEATPEAEAESPPPVSVSPPVDDATRAQGRPMGSGADESAAASGGQMAESGSATADSDRPRSAFGPNARPKPESPPPESPTRAQSSKPEKARSEPTRAASAKSDSAKQGVAKGWAVQLGVFEGRDNAERLAKRVRGSGFTVLFDETSGKDGKKLYWVRVGPEADRAGAVALSARLKAAGYRENRVVEYP